MHLQMRRLPVGSLDCGLLNTRGHIGQWRGVHTGLVPDVHDCFLLPPFVGMSVPLLLNNDMTEHRYVLRAPAISPLGSSTTRLLGANALRDDLQFTN